MAKYELKNSECIAGPLYVDATCIDCGTCFHIAPDIFKEHNALSYTFKQPVGLDEWTKAKEALLSCPTNSIGVNNPPDEFKDAPIVLPRHIEDNIYFCGYNAESSFGATSYLIKHAEGNILVDCPRFNLSLAKRIEELGGLKYIFLTHKDDVADHQKYADHFQCQRIIHAEDVEEQTSHCEIILHNSEDVSILSNVKAVMTPGHTRGHMVLLYKNKFIFSGDHLFYDSEKNEIYASQSVNWYSWNEQVQSLHKLTRYDFEWVMPGHGGWTRMDPSKIKKTLLEIH